MSTPRCCGEVIRNTACGKEFWVCRECKQEVPEGGRPIEFTLPEGFSVDTHKLGLPQHRWGPTWLIGSGVGAQDWHTCQDCALQHPCTTSGGPCTGPWRHILNPYPGPHQCAHCGLMAPDLTRDCPARPNSRAPIAAPVSIPSSQLLVRSHDWNLSNGPLRPGVCNNCGVTGGITTSIYCTGKKKPMTVGGSNPVPSNWRPYTPFKIDWAAKVEVSPAVEAMKACYPHIYPPKDKGIDKSDIFDALLYDIRLSTFVKLPSLPHRWSPSDHCESCGITGEEFEQCNKPTCEEWKNS